MSFDDAVADQPDELEPPVDTHADDMAFWLYSSGSTGRPKGVVHTHADIAVTVDTYARQVLRLGEADVCYWHQRSKTRQCMRGDWFFTGDRYIKTPDGYFAYQGRADDMIKVGGLWVSPADMEACLVSHPAVSEAAVIGVHVDEVSRVKAFVICAQQPVEREALADELRQWCKDRLRRYEYPHYVAFVDDLPRTPTGNIQRYKLRDAETVKPGPDAAAAPVSAASA